MTFVSGQCLAPQSVGSCTGGEESKVPANLSAEASFDAFAVVQSLECTAMGRTQLGSYANDSLDVTREYAVGRELLTGAASGNPSLADATVLGLAADGPVAALECLEQTAADDMHGRLAFIHASFGLATELLSASAIWRDGRLWRTAAGNILVVSAGYDGRDPGGEAPVEGDTAYLYATGEVYAEVGQRENLNDVERGTNTLHSIAEDAAIVLFDPCFSVAIDTGVSFCELEVVS